MSVEPTRCEEEWTEASLSSSPTSSYEDVGGKNGACDMAELSSFILVSEGNSFEAPPTFSPVVNPVPGSSEERSKDSMNSKGGEDRALQAPQSSEICITENTKEEMEFSLLNIPPPTQREGSCRPDSDRLKSPEASGTSSAFFNEESLVPILSESANVKVDASHKEALLAKNANRELKLKMAKLSEILDRKVAEMEALRHSVTDFQAEAITLKEEKWNLELAVRSKDTTIADLKLEISKNMNDTPPKVSQDKPEKLKLLEKANLELSAENKGLKKKLQQLALENKTLYERSTTLLTQIQDCETKRKVEACEKQVLEGKVDRLIDEMCSMRKELQGSRGHVLPTSTQPCGGYTHKELSGNSRVDERNTGGVAVGKEWSQERHAPTKPKDHQRQEHRSKALADQSKPVQETKGASGHFDRNIASHKGTQQSGSSSSKNPKSQLRVQASDGYSSSVDIECPMCGKQLAGTHSLVAMHVERCIQLSEMKEQNISPQTTTGNKS